MKIDNAQLTSSSIFGLHKPYYGRLNLLSFHGDPSRSAWCATAGDKDPYLQVDFGQDTTLSGVAVQGLSLFDNFVTSFRLCYSNDGNEFECVQEAGGEKVSWILGSYSSDSRLWAYRIQETKLDKEKFSRKT